MDTRTAKQLTGGLAETSKMPCPSWSIPARECRTGGKLVDVEGSVCASCYALKGNYVRFRKTVEPAQYRRLELSEGEGWVDAMVVLIRNNAYFRWFDSGDLQSVEMLERIVQIVRRTPRTTHWLPTREYGMVKKFIDRHGREAIPSNLTIRLSALFVDRPPVLPASLREHPQIKTSTVYSPRTPVPVAFRVCPAYSGEQQGRCDDCRACWDTSVDTVAYKAH